MKVSDNKQKLIFPGGGTQFKSEHGALHYIEYIEKVKSFAPVYGLGFYWRWIGNLHGVTSVLTFFVFVFVFVFARSFPTFHGESMCEPF